MNRPPRSVGLAGIGLAVLALIAAAWIAAVSLGRLPGYLSATMLTAVALSPAGWIISKLIRFQAAHWVGPYLRDRPEPIDRAAPLDICFAFIDHFEPDHGCVSRERQLDRVQGWQAAYRSAICDHVDSDGRAPQHTWFVPVALLSPDVLPAIACWPRLGWGEIEYHLHHDDTPDISLDALRQRICGDIRALQGIGAVSSGRYGFVHGMMALAGGDRRYCRVAREIDVLLDPGCYADFTFPAVGTPAQPRMVNRILRVLSDGCPKPYDRAVPARVNGPRTGLLLVPGPSAFGLFPRVLDDANLDQFYPPSPGRIRRWLDAHVHVPGRPNWLFILVHSHSAPEPCVDALFAGPMQKLWSALEHRFKGPNTRLHYVTAREVYNIVTAAEAGHDGNPDDYRDFDIAPPASGRSAPGRRAG